MDTSRELEALRAEQRRLQFALDQLGQRINALEHSAKPDPIPRSIPEIISTPEPPAFKPAFDSPPQIEPPRPPAILSTIVEKPSPEPQPAPAPRQPRESLELRLGRVWLARIGIVILLTGFVFLGNYAYHELIGRIGPVGKLVLIYFAGGALCALGAWIGRKQESLKTYSRVLLAGGCATIYYATYAAHFVPTLRVIESPLLAGTLLLALGGLFVFLADRLRSQTLAAATIALSFYTAAINPTETFSLFSNLVISAAAVVLLARRRWVSVSFLSLVGAYGAFAFWRFQQTHTFSPAVAADQFWPALLFPAAYWVVHTAAVMLRRLDAFDPTVRPTFLTLNNAAFFALAGPVVAGAYPQLFWLAALIYGAVLVALAAIASRRSGNEPYFDGAYLAQGLGLIVLGLFYKLSDVEWQQAISFALLSGTLVSLGRLRHGGVYRFFAGIAATIAAGGVLEAIAEGVPHARLVATGVTVILAFTGWLLKKQFGLLPRCDWRVLGFALLAAGLCIPAGTDSDLLASALRILGVALIAMLSLRVLKLPEFAYSAQPLALCGQVFLIVQAVIHSDSPAAVLVSSAFALAFVHLWQWPGQILLAGRRTWQALHVIAPECLVLWWSFMHLNATERGPVLALLALPLLVYGCLSKIRVLALASPPLTITAFGVTASALADKLPWHSPALAAGLLALQSLVLSRLAGRHDLAQFLRAASLALGTGMIFVYLPASAWFLALAFATLAFFIATCFRRSGETMLYAGLLAAIAATVWLGRLFTAPAGWTDFLGFGAAIVAQRLGRRRLAETGWFGPQIQVLLCSAIVFGMWILLHRLVAATAGGFLLTVSWSLLALVVLVGGFALRDRAYRLLGLIVLAGAVGRIFCIDVWQLETIYRMISFLVLGVVLLALSFLYNRFADTLRRWL